MVIEVARQRAGWRTVSLYLGRRKWSYIFGAFVWALVWYATMDLLKLWVPESQWDFDIMPVVAGIPIILVGWRAVALDRQLRDSIDNFDDGAAFAFPAGKPGARRIFLEDVRGTIRWWSRTTAAVITASAIVATISIAMSAFEAGNDFAVYPALLLAVGVPLIALPVGVLLGQLVGFAQLLRVMDRNGIALAGLATPQAREALRGLEGIFTFAVIATMVMCLWFAAWWVAWAFGLDPFDYEADWKSRMLVWWALSVILFILAAAWPAWRFRRRVVGLSGGPEGKRAIEDQVRQAEADLQRLRQAAAEKPRYRREQIADLERFIANLKDQRIGTWVLDERLHAALLTLNLMLFLLPPLLTGKPFH
jgi:hypothetical protein